MANPKHVKILKSGVKKWNKWRESNKDLKPDLSGADLSGIYLDGPNLTQKNRPIINLSEVDLSKSNLTEARLSDANLSNANLSGANLNNAYLFMTKIIGANLERAQLVDASLSSADLSGANLFDANLSGASLSGANLSGANLSGARFFYSHIVGVDLTDANLTGADLSNSNFTDSIFYNTRLTDCKLQRTIFGLTNLDNCIGLESVEVSSPCVIDFPTLRASKNLPNEFLVKLGIPDLLMEYLPDFYNPALMIYPAFLSHSWADKGFVRKLYEGLTKKGVTVWLDEKKMKPGDNIHDSIAEGIKYYDKLILVCSENSLNSWWVEKELERVYEKERQLQKQHGKKFRLVIPIRLDDQIFNSDGDIFDTLRNSMIGDFTKWQDESEFQKALKELVDALNANRPNIKPPSFLM